MYQADQYRVYYPVQTRQFGRYLASYKKVLWLLFLPMCATARAEPSNDQVALFRLIYVGLILMLVGLMGWLVNRHTRLVISDEVIEYYTLGYSIIGSWYSVETIKEVLLDRTAVECLVFRQALYIRAWWHIDIALFDDLHSRSIPLDDFGHWRSMKLGCELAHLDPAAHKPKTFTASQHFEETMTKFWGEVFSHATNPTGRRKWPH